MTTSTQPDVLVLRTAALLFAFLSAYFTFTSRSWHFLVVAQAFSVMAILALAVLRARLGWRQTYSHPVAVFTILLLLPAQVLTLCIPALPNAH